MSELELLRHVAPPVEPASSDVLLRARGRLARAQAGRTGHRMPRRGLVLGPVALAACLAVAVVVTQLGGGEHTRAFAAEAVRLAKSSPRLLVDGDGWKVTRVDEWSAGTGEMTFAAGKRELELHWWPASQDGTQAPAGTGKDSDYEAAAQVLGTPVTVHRYSGTNDYTAYWHDGDTTIEARALAANPAEFVALLHRLQQVDVNSWLTAMPASAVTPQDHGDAVAKMLDGLPVPSGLNVDRLRTSTVTRDRYQLGSQVAGAVACGWIAQWVDAKRTGDTAAARQAVGALATSRRWPILNEMNADGDYPEAVWQFADALAGNGTVTMGKPGMTVASTYKDALGCPIS